MTEAPKSEEASAPACDGFAHIWEILETDEGQPGLAIATCCGCRAVFGPGGWMMEPVLCDDTD